MRRSQRYLTICFCASLLFYACGDFFNNPDTTVALEEIITVTADQDSLLADGFSYTAIRATLPKEAQGKTVTFTTDSGTLRRTGAMGDSTSKTFTVKAAAGSAHVFLRSGTDVRDTIVSAHVDSFTNFTVVRCIRAYPNNIVLSADPAILVVDSISSSEISVTLLRDKGLVSKKTLIQFTVVKKGSLQPFGNIPASALSDAEGKARVLLANSDSIGTAVVTAFVENTNEDKRIERSVEVAFNQ
jgi:hypothetical protein